jgi:tRNA(Ile)-lysidine synthase
MRTSLEQSVLAHIRERRMIGPGDNVAVAVSGGADSVALLRILEAIRRELGINLGVAHFDHQLRGQESDQDAEFVAQLARSCSVEFMLGRADVASEAKRNGWNLEDAARRLRYAFFARLAAEGRATHVAVAHTADDQAETVLAHLLRGTGPTGMAGIYPLAGTVVRPLLEIRRRELRAYLTGMKQSWREDATNQDPSRLRARIRGRLLPIMERDFSPRIVQHLCQLAQLSREERDFWDALVEERFRALIQMEDREKGTALKSSVRDLLRPFGETAALGARNAAAEGEPQAWQALTERIIRRVYQELRGDRCQLTSRHVAQVIRLAVKSRSGRSVELPGGIRVERRFGDLVFSAGANRATARNGEETNRQRVAYQYNVNRVSLGRRGSTTVRVPEIGIRFRLKRIDWAKAQRDTTGDSQVLDANSLNAPLILRSWRPGDAYTPRGRLRPRKLKQMFLAARIPRDARREWPVLESAGRVIWARGMPAAEGFCASRLTRVGVVIEEDGI